MRKPHDIARHRPLLFCAANPHQVVPLRRMTILTRPDCITSTYNAFPGVVSLWEPLHALQYELSHELVRVCPSGLCSFTQVGPGHQGSRPSLHRECSELCGLNSLMMNGREHPTTATDSIGRTDVPGRCTLSIGGEEVTTKGNYRRGRSHRPSFLWTGGIKDKGCKK